MKARTLLVLASLLTMLLGIFGLGTLQEARIEAQEANQNASGQVPPGFDLRRLERLDDGRLSPDDAAQIYLSFLREEVASPSPPRQGIGGGVVTHDYILAQIVLAGWHSKAKEAVLWQAAASSPPGEYRDAILLTLGLFGDQRVLPFLIDYLGNRDNPPFLRQRAARALRSNPDARAIPVLLAALGDPFYVITKVGPSKRYDIRIAARAALQRIKEAKIPIPDEVQRAMDTVVTSEVISKDAAVQPDTKLATPGR